MPSPPLYQRWFRLCPSAILARCGQGLSGEGVGAPLRAQTGQPASHGGLYLAPGCETRRHGQDLVTEGKAFELGSGPGVPRSGGFQKSLTVLPGPPVSESSVAGAVEGVLTGLLALSCRTGWL